MNIHKDAIHAAEIHANLYMYFAKIALHEYHQGGDTAASGIYLFRLIWPDLYSAWERMGPNQKKWTRSKFADKWLANFVFQFSDLLDLAVHPRHRISILQFELIEKRTNRSI
jgi:hypothetical protein